MSGSTSRIVARVLLIVVLLAGVSPAHADQWVVPSDRVVDSVPVRAAASGSAAELARLNVGAHADFLDAKPNWYHVRLGDGTEAYVSKAWTTLTAAVAAAPTPGTQQPSTGGLANVPPVTPGSRAMNAHFINVGQGAATLLEFPCGAVLIDTGGEKNDPFDGTANLMAYLDAFFARRTDLSGTLDGLILTHPHKDHTAGACQVIQQYHPRNLVDDGMHKPSASGAAGQQCLEEAGASGTPYEGISLSDITSPTGITDAIIDPVACSPIDPQLRVLFGQAPWGTQTLLPGWTTKDANDENNHSVATRVDFGKFSMLVTGDLRDRGISELLKRSGSSGILDVDVYEVGHHGSANGTTAPLMAAMTPKAAVIEMGDSQRHGTFSAFEFGHPNQVAITLLTDPGNGVSDSRSPVTEPVGLKGRNPGTHAPPVWTTETIDRAVYGTGWDGTIVIHADDAGKFDVFTEH